MVQSLGLSCYLQRILNFEVRSFSLIDRYRAGVAAAAASHAADSGLLVANLGIDQSKFTDAEICLTWRVFAQCQGQLLGDVGSLKSQLIGTIRQQSTRTSS